MPTTARAAAVWAWLAVWCLAWAGCGHAGQGAAPREGAVEVTAGPVALDPAEPRRCRLGRLLWRGGLELASPHPAFGGLSGLWVAPDGGRLLAVSDRGWWLSAGLRHDVAGFLTGLAGAELLRLSGPDGRPLEGKARADAEELAPSPGGGLAVSLERRHRVLVYPPAPEPLAGRPRLVELPGWLAGAPENRGPEAAAYLPDGRLVVLAEGREGREVVPGGLLAGGGWRRLDYRPAPGLRPTAACAPPGGGLAVLERSFSPLTGVSVRLALVPAAGLRPGAELEGETLARLAAPLTVDNMEGLACRSTPAGLMLYLVSDDNFSPLQRTLLLAFLLPAGD